MSSLPYHTYREKISLLKKKKLSLTDNVRFFVKRIEDNAHLNAFNFVFQENAIADAERIERKILNGEGGKLAGMVIAVKDVLSMEGKPNTCSSEFLKDFKALYTATAVERLLAEDAVIIGRTNCDEFAMGSSNENSAFNPVLNPHNTDYVPGGSSGGSAAAVAAELCDTALGTDTGGSIRQPASFCGIYGLKPTYARVSRYGLTAFASSFDTIGPFARSPEDIAEVLNVIAGWDEKDSTSSMEPVPDYLSSLQQQEKSFTVGLPKEYFDEGLDPEIAEIISGAVNRLTEAGIEVKDVSLPNSEYSVAAYYILTTAEASSNLARYDGARYGRRSEKSSTLIEMYNNSRTEGFGKEVKRRIMLGTYVLSAGYYDAYYKKAQKVRRIIRDDFTRVFNDVDVLLTPTAPVPVFRLGEKLSDPLAMYLTDVYTTSANLAGIPGISVPVGKSANNLPVGLQLFGSFFQEEKLLLTARLLHKLLWH